MHQNWRIDVVLLSTEVPLVQILGGDLAGVVEEADASSRFRVGDMVRK